VNVMDDILRWAGIAVTALGAAFGYGHLHQRVASLEQVSRDTSHKLDQILTMVSETKERIARIEGRQ